MAKGGARPGAGRPKGSKYMDLRAAFERQDPKAVENYIKHLLANYKTDPRLTVWVGEHIFGKPAQEVDLSGTIAVTFDEETSQKARKAIGEVLDSPNA